MYKKAFTLAEIMIVLTIIGVLTAILLPVAFQSAPDENVMKFKKANNTLGSVIRELVNSDAYYSGGDFGIKANGTQIKGSTNNEKKYFCSSFADILSTKSVACSTASNDSYGAVQTYSSGADKTSTAQTNLDTYCASAASNVKEEIVTTDGIVYYQGSPALTFGSIASGTTRNFGTGGKYKDANGFDVNYKVFCIDVDGISGPEKPFGYGIRADGKILPGKRALEWTNKSVQQGD